MRPTNMTMLRLFLLLVNVFAVLSQEWKYYGPTGPEYWPELYVEYCAGDSQSPIDIKSGATEPSDIGPIVLNGYGGDDTPSEASMQMINNGHAVQVNVQGDYHMEGGPLPSIFQMTQLHFHWGSQDGRGSEHMVDGRQYEAEMHVVHYDREKFDNFNEAVKEKGGVVVLGILIEVSEEDNPAFEPIVNGLPSILYEGNTYNLPDVFPISSIFPSEEERNNFYFYEGSLTTPVCNEVVQWIVYKNSVTISENQLTAFRSVYEDGAEEPEPRHLVDTYRPTQPLNARIVYSAKASMVSVPSTFALIFLTLVVHFMINARNYD